MTDRLAIDQLLRELYAARARGNLDDICRTFAEDAAFRIAGASHASPIAITAAGIGEIRSWLALMIKSFQLQDSAIVSLIIDGPRAAAHWRATVHSRITGAVVLTEFVDLVEVRDRRIVSYLEFFAPR